MPMIHKMVHMWSSEDRIASAQRADDAGLDGMMQARRDEGLRNAASFHLRSETGSMGHETGDRQR